MPNFEFRLDIPEEPLTGELSVERQMLDVLDPDFLTGVHHPLRFSRNYFLSTYNAGWGSAQ